MQNDFSTGAGTWTASPAALWSIVSEGSNSVYQFDHNYPNVSGVSTAGSAGWSNYRVTADVKITVMNSYSEAYLLARYVDANNHYVLALCYEGGTTVRKIRLKKRVNGAVTTLAEASSTSFTTNTWHELMLEVSGNKLTGWLDGVPVLQATDSSLTDGGIGLGTWKQDVRFDHVEVEMVPTIGGGTLASPAAGPAPAYGIGGPGMVLVKNWDFGATGTIKTMADLNEHFQYHNQFGRIDNGDGKYGSLIISPNAANAVPSQPIEGVNTNRPVREFFADSMRTYLVPLNGASVVDPDLHNTGNGSFQAKFTLPNGGSLLGRDIVWQTRVRYVTPPYYWFAIWTAGNMWTEEGAEIDLIESYGYDKGGGDTNFQGLYWLSAIRGTAQVINYTNRWKEAMEEVRVMNFTPTQYHVWTMHYRRDNTVSVYVDGTEVQKGTIYWTRGSVDGGTPINMSFIFDAGWGHTRINSVNFPLPATAFDGKFYEWDYSRIYLGTEVSQSYRAEADTFVQGGYPSTSYGTSTTLALKDGAGTSLDRISYLRFPVAGPVGTARLKLKVVSVGGEGAGPKTVEVRRLSHDSWNEGMTWNTKPSTTGELIAAIDASVVGHIYTIDVTDYVKTQVGANDGKASFVLIQPANVNRFVGFGSDESAHPGDRSVLEVVPPAAGFSFEDGFASGSAAWSADPAGLWSVVSDGGDHAYQFDHNYPNVSGASTAGSAGWSNYRVTADVKITVMNSYSEAYLFARYVDANNHYVLALCYEGGPTVRKIRLKKRVNGVVTTLAESASATFNANTWHEMTLEANGNTLTGWLDGVAVLQAADFSLASGGIGLGAWKQDVRFDNVVVE